MGFSFEYINMDEVPYEDEDEDYEEELCEDEDPKEEPCIDLSYSSMGVVHKLLDHADVLDRDIPIPLLQDLFVPEDDDDPRLSVRSLDAGRVPLLKLVSGNGWHILPDEATIIGAALHKVLADKSILDLEKISEDDLLYYLEFANFCLRASQHGGFIVF